MINSMRARLMTGLGFTDCLSCLVGDFLSET